MPYGKKDGSVPTTLTVCSFTAKCRTRRRTVACPRLCPSAASPPRAVREEGLQCVHDFDRPQLHRQVPYEKKDCSVSMTLAVCSFTAKCRTRRRTSVVVALLLLLLSFCCCSFVVVLLLLLLLSSANNCSFVVVVLLLL